MNWRTITGLILLVVGIRVLYIALEASGSKALMAGIGGAIWITAGMFFILRTITKKEQN
jgi:hypothetical protein